MKSFNELIRKSANITFGLSVEKYKHFLKLDLILTASMVMFQSYKKVKSGILRKDEEG